MPNLQLLKLKRFSPTSPWKTRSKRSKGLRAASTSRPTGQKPMVSVSDSFQRRAVQGNVILFINVQSATQKHTGRRTVRSPNRILFSNLGQAAVVKVTYLMNSRRAQRHVVAARLSRGPRSSRETVILI